MSKIRTTSPEATRRLGDLGDRLLTSVVQMNAEADAMLSELGARWDAARRVVEAKTDRPLGHAPRGT